MNPTAGNDAPRWSAELCCARPDATESEYGDTGENNQKLRAGPCMAHVVAFWYVFKYIRLVRIGEHQGVSIRVYEEGIDIPPSCVLRVQCRVCFSRSVSLPPRAGGFC